jgi:hypothetical protein
MAMAKVHFPRSAPWWSNAKQQILTYPYAPHDDFVAWLALIGLGLTKQFEPSRLKKTEKRDWQVGSMPWILAKANEKARKDKRADRKGW